VSAETVVAGGAGFTAGIAEIWRGTWVIAYRELLRFVNERSRLVSSVIQPLIFLVVFGAGFGNVIGNLAPGVNFVQFMYPGIIAMGVLTSSLFAGVSVVWDREFGFLRELLVAPLARTGIVLGKALGAAVVALVQVVLMLVVAPFVGVSLDVALVVRLIPVVVILSVALSGLGILLASFMRSQQGFQLLIQILIFPLIFLAGVFFPVDQAPDWLQVLSKLNPMTYGVDAIRQIFLGAPASAGLGVKVFGQTMTIAQEMLLVAALGGILFAIAVWAFRRQE
jgi:ABC-2 type transport system permease protein